MLGPTRGVGGRAWYLLNVTGHSEGGGETAGRDPGPPRRTDEGSGHGLPASPAGSQAKHGNALKIYKYIRNILMSIDENSKQCSGA